MCFGGGSSRPEPVSPTVTEEQKEQKKKKLKKKLNVDKKLLKKRLLQIHRLKHNLLMRWVQKLERQLYEEEEEEELYIQVVEVV